MKTRARVDTYWVKEPHTPLQDVTLTISTDLQFRFSRYMLLVVTLQMLLGTPEMQRKQTNTVVDYAAAAAEKKVQLILH